MRVHPVKLLLRKILLPGQVLFAPARCTHQLPAEVEVLVEQAWQETLARPGVHLFDGPMVRMERWELAGSLLRVWVSTTGYRRFLGTNMRHPELADRYGPGILANPIGVSMALISDDSRLLLGRRNAKVAYYPDRLHPFAGALEPRDRVDVFDDARRELQEELSISPDELDDLALLGMAEDLSLRQPEMIVRARAKLKASEIRARLDPAEHADIVDVPLTSAALADLLERSDLTPVAAATIQLAMPE